MATRAQAKESAIDKRVLPTAPARRHPGKRRRWKRWAALVVVCCAALWLFREALVRLPWRPINEVTILGARNVDPQVIREAAQVSVSAPMFSVNIDSVIARVKAVPWVLDARVTRRLSGRFEIHVSERVPVALIWDGEFHLLDASGYTAPLDGTPAPDAPLVTGLRLDRAHVGEELEHLGWALRIVSELEPLRSVVSEVSLADSTMMVMVLSPNGIPAFFPRLPGRDRLVMVASLVASHPEVVRQAIYLDARFTGHVAVRS